MRITRWMIYGAYGYTGRLLAAEAKARGLNPVLAGRDPHKLRDLAKSLSLESCAFALDDSQATASRLQGFGLLLNAAGPFVATAEAALAGCLSAGCHYLDITGEIEVFEHAQTLDPEARRSGIIVCPGVGFDVIPTDCMAATLKAALPDATELALAFHSSSGASPGTAKTAIEAMAKGGRIRRDGRIERVPHGYRSREIDFGDGARLAITIPWGDIATAFHTTGIPNIETYMAIPRQRSLQLKLLRLAQPLLGLMSVQRLLKRAADRHIGGPDAAHRADNPSWIWGEVRNAAGDVCSGRIRTANGYDVTVHGALGVVNKLLSQPHPPGTYTPAQLMGKNYIATLPGSSDFSLQCSASARTGTAA